MDHLNIDHTRALPRECTAGGSYLGSVCTPFKLEQNANHLSQFIRTETTPPLIVCLRGRRVDLEQFPSLAVALLHETTGSLPYAVLRVLICSELPHS